MLILSFIDFSGTIQIEEEVFLVDSCTTNTILRKSTYFQTLKKSKGNVTTIAGRDAVIVGSGRATITLPMVTQLEIGDALLYPDLTRTLLSFKDICKNALHTETHSCNNEEFLLITKDNGYGKQIFEKKNPSLSTGLYYTYIKPEQHVAYKIIFQNIDVYSRYGMIALVILELG